MTDFDREGLDLGLAPSSKHRVLGHFPPGGIGAIPGTVLATAAAHRRKRES
ncbi:hypothetical protein ACODT3_39985 [Streptomyces sp. 4.24]|uniref:hypothetical protein n=1 Tax=Streptomyces tritrimontium TaxID=3406573 RepID=UPI003BB57A5C